jgi:hypothetical protein
MYFLNIPQPKNVTHFHPSVMAPLDVFTQRRKGWKSRGEPRECSAKHADTQRAFSPGDGVSLAVLGNE